VAGASDFLNELRSLFSTFVLVRTTSTQVDLSTGSLVITIEDSARLIEFSAALVRLPKNFFRSFCSLYASVSNSLVWLPGKSDARALTVLLTVGIVVKFELSRLALELDSVLMLLCWCAEFKFETFRAFLSISMNLCELSSSLIERPASRR